MCICGLHVFSPRSGSGLLLGLMHNLSVPSLIAVRPLRCKCEWNVLLIGGLVSSITTTVYHHASGTVHVRPWSCEKALCICRVCIGVLATLVHGVQYPLDPLVTKGNRYMK